MKKKLIVLGILIGLVLTLCAAAIGETAEEQSAFFNTVPAGGTVTAENKAIYQYYPRGSNVKIFTFWNYGAEAEPDAYFLDNGRIFADVAFTYSGRNLRVEVEEGGSWLKAGFKDNGSWYFRLKKNNTTNNVRKGSFVFYDSKGKVITFTVYNCPVLKMKTTVTKKGAKLKLTATGSGKKYGLKVKYQFLVYKPGKSTPFRKYKSGTGTVTKKLTNAADYEVGVRPYIKLGNITVYANTFRVYKFRDSKLKKLKFTGEIRTVN